MQCSCHVILWKWSTFILSINPPGLKLSALALVRELKKIVCISITEAIVWVLASVYQMIKCWTVRRLQNI